MSKLDEQLKGRGNNKEIQREVEAKLASKTVVKAQATPAGPSEYELEKAQEDAWE